MNVTIHTNKATIDLETQQVTLTGIDLSELLSDIPAKEILDTLDFEHVADYYIDKLKDE